MVRGIEEYRQFQSHLGLIFSMADVNADGRNGRFQSHLGLIFSRRSSNASQMPMVISIPPWSDFLVDEEARRWRPKSISIPPWSDFLVALREKGNVLRVISIPPWSDFLEIWLNHSYVLDAISIPPWSDFLKERRQPQRRCVLRFQSHLGLIFSRRRQQETQEEKPHFNPTLVWFSQGGSRQRAADGRDAYFNPTLVWFSRLTMLPLGTLAFLFQSHLGLIFSLLKDGMQGITHRISIPPWSDFLL